MARGDLADADAAAAAAHDADHRALCQRAREIGIDPDKEIGAILAPLTIARIHGLLDDIAQAGAVFSASTKAGGMKRVADCHLRDVEQIRRLLSPPAIPKSWRGFDATTEFGSPIPADAPSADADGR